MCSKTILRIIPVQLLALEGSASTECKCHAVLFIAPSQLEQSICTKTMRLRSLATVFGHLMTHAAEAP